MFQTILSYYDVFRTDIPAENSVIDNIKKDEIFSTNPADFLSSDGFYF